MAKELTSAFDGSIIIGWSTDSVSLLGHQSHTGGG